MLSMYVIILLWDLFTILIAVLTSIWLSAVENKTRRYVTYQQQQISLSNQRLQETASQGPITSSLMTGVTTTGVMWTTEHTGPQMIGYTSPMEQMIGYTGYSDTTPAAPRKRVRKTSPTKRTKKKKEKPVPLTPLPPGYDFFEDQRME